jgi:hypothetical protein
MFEQYPDYPKFRTLMPTEPHQRGEDVYALQSALIALGFHLPDYGADGDLGGETADAIKAAQRKYGLTTDGKAGAQTQRELALAMAAPASAAHDLPGGLLKGQMAHESSFRLGIYSVQYGNGSYDAGVVQRNTALTPPKQGFTPAPSIETLAAQARRYFDRFGGIATRRRWQLAQGTWNAPAWACFIAREEGAKISTSETLRPTPGQRATLEAYMASVSAYLEV